MRKLTKNKYRFANSYSITSLGTIVIVILIAHFIFNRSITFKEIELDKPVTDSAFYHLSNRTGWHKIDLGAFSIETPKTYLYTEMRGIDSRVGQFANKSDTILFDYGLYSYDFSDEIGDASFENWTATINGRLFTIIRRKGGIGFVGAYTEDLSDRHTFSISCDCNSSDSLIEIIKTVKFIE